MKFTKMQGLGNDYIYINAFEERVDDPPALARRLSDRHFGVGGDGLVLIAPSDKADFRMVMYNADGSRGAMCGNASRCVGKYVYDRGMTDKTVVTLETDSGVKTLNLTVENGRTQSVCVDMGAPILACEAVPCLLGQGVVKRAPITVLGRRFEITPVSMGNPHGVIFLDEPVETFDLTKYGPALECHPAFPKKVNIEFVNVLSEKRLRMRVWERGSGVTLACGTGSCAALVAAFFALNHALPLHPDELLLLAVGAALGGVLGDLASARFFAMITRESAMLLQNALLFTLIALPSLYFGPLSRTVAPMRLSRLLSFAVALLVGLLGSFLAFGAEPLTLTLYFLLFGADVDEGAFAALTVSLFAMVGKLLVLLIRQRLVLPDADVMLWLLPGAVIGALLALWPVVRRGRSNLSALLLRLSLFTSLLNIAAAALH